MNRRQPIRWYQVSVVQPHGLSRKYRYARHSLGVAVRGSGRARASPTCWNSLASRGPHQAHGSRIIIDLSRELVADGGRALLADQRALPEPVQAEGRDDLRGLAGRDALRHRLAGHRAGLEPVGAPADVD